MGLKVRGKVKGMVGERLGKGGEKVKEWWEEKWGNGGEKVGKKGEWWRGKGILVTCQSAGTLPAHPASHDPNHRHGPV